MAAAWRGLKPSRIHKVVTGRALCRSIFREKANEDAALINGGFMVCNPKIFDYLDEGDNTVLEQRPLCRLVEDGELKAFRHDGFWRCMDTKREKDMLEKLWESGAAPWKVWED